jgi:hypothetical protein
MTISAQLTPPAPSRPSPFTHDPEFRRNPHGRHGRHGRSGWAPPGSEHPATERPTRQGPTGVRAEPATPVDAFALLDHRTRSRSVALPDAPPGRYLSAEDGEEVRLIALDQPIIRIGRGLSADVRVEDPQVSRRHAIIAQRGDGTRVLDDRSSNGTHVNGHAVTIGYLDDGDVLQIGRAVLRFVEIGSPARARPVRRFSIAAVAPRQVVSSDA